MNHLLCYQGWPPLNHIVVEALENTNEKSAQDLAFQLAQKWVRSNHLAYVQKEAMFEKVSLLNKNNIYMMK